MNNFSILPYSLAYSTACRKYSTTFPTSSSPLDTEASSGDFSPPHP
jgi:hypothetical protein